MQKPQYVNFDFMQTSAPLFDLAYALFYTARARHGDASRVRLCISQASHILRVNSLQAEALSI